jgi:dienelactone hydrolase
MAQTIASDLEYSFDGTRMIGRRFAPVGAGDVPGVLVIHAAHGLGDQVLGCAERVAALGYAVLAIDLWGDRKQITNPAEIGPMAMSMPIVWLSWAIASAVRPPSNLFARAHP